MPVEYILWAWGSRCWTRGASHGPKEILKIPCPPGPVERKTITGHLHNYKHGTSGGRAARKCGRGDSGAREGQRRSRARADERRRGARPTGQLFPRRKARRFGIAALSRKLDDATELARVTGTSVGRAKAIVDTGRALRDADQVTDAMQHGVISLDQATEIVRAEQAS